MSMAMNKIEKSPRELAYEVGTRKGLSSTQVQQLMKLIERRFPNEQDPYYIAEWADRISGGYAYEAGDSKTRKIWLDILKGK